MSNISTMNENDLKKLLAELDAKEIALTTIEKKTDEGDIPTPSCVETHATPEFEPSRVIKTSSIEEREAAVAKKEAELAKKEADLKLVMRIAAVTKLEDEIKRKAAADNSEFEKKTQRERDNAAYKIKCDELRAKEREEAAVAKKEAELAKKEADLKLVMRIAAVTKLEDEIKRKAAADNSEFEKKTQRERDNAAYKIKCDELRAKEREEAAARRYAPMFVVGVHRPVVGLDYRSLKSSSYPIMGSHYGYGIGVHGPFPPMLPPMFIARH